MTRVQKLIRPLFTVACIGGAALAIYVGHEIFHDRIRIFWIFTGYVVILTGIAIFFGFRLIEMLFK